jgi:hypothetical protein
MLPKSNAWLWIGGFFFLLLSTHWWIAVLYALSLLIARETENPLPLPCVPLSSVVWWVIMVVVICGIYELSPGSYDQDKSYIPTIAAIFLIPMILIRRRTYHLHY